MNGAELPQFVPLLQFALAMFAVLLALVLPLYWLNLTVEREMSTAMRTARALTGSLDVEDDPVAINAELESEEVPDCPFCKGPMMKQSSHHDLAHHHADAWYCAKYPRCLARVEA